MVCSSGAARPADLRGHHDVANLLVLCGAKGMETAARCLGASSGAVVKRATLRRLRKAAAVVEDAR